ncbi:MAG: hypothetical protein KIS61_09315 [Candidatus Eremiobacteraeota bacterium]|nr:hypothetical protein [Candidatus Eremiobacteraeota bacterium]
MPAAFDACIIDLTASGVDQERARRACTAAFWAETGMLPDQADAQGVPGPDCRGYARACVAELAGIGRPGRMLPGGKLQDVAKLESFGIPGAVAQTPARVTREVLMLAPGRVVDATGKEFDFTPDDILAYRDNFDPTDQPPIVLDHSLTAQATVGKIRALKVDAGRLVGLWEFLGEENVKPVLDGRWSRTSGRFAQTPDRSGKVIIEGSIVWRGAYDRGYGDRSQVLPPAGQVASLGRAAAPIKPPGNVVQAADWADHSFLEAMLAQGLLPPGTAILTPPRAS